MYLKQIIKNLDERELFEFYNLNDRETSQYLARFSILSEEEKKKYEKCSENEKKDFVSKSEKIFLPYMTTDVFAEYHNLNEINKITYDLTINRIKKLIKLKSKNEEKIAFALYNILHEIGHWVDFKEKMESKPYIFIKKDLKAKTNINKKYSKLNKRIKNPFNLSEEEKIYIERLFKEYHSIPSEKSADEYADKNLGKSMEKLLKQSRE